MTLSMAFRLWQFVQCRDNARITGDKPRTGFDEYVAIQRLSTGFRSTECRLALSLFCSFASFTSEVCLSSLSATDPAWPCHVSSDFSVAYYVVSSSSPLAPYSCFLSSTICSAAAATNHPPQLSTPPSVTEHSGLYEIIVKVVKIEKINNHTQNMKLNHLLIGLATATETCYGPVSSNLHPGY